MMKRAARDWATILYTAAEALRLVTALVHPVIPESTAKIWTQLGLHDIRKCKPDGFAVGSAEAWNSARQGGTRISTR